MATFGASYAAWSPLDVKGASQRQFRYGARSFTFEKSCTSTLSFRRVLSGLNFHNRISLRVSNCVPREPRRSRIVYCVVTDSIVSGAQVDTTKEATRRRLILLRHAKSSWSDRSIKDHERPLSKKGRQAAASISVKLQEHSGWLPQLILCSNSTRTRETLNIMQQHVPELLDAEVHFLSSFYSVAAMDGETLQHLQEVICKYTNDDITTVTCMGHNKGWEEAASILAGIHIKLKEANAALLEAYGSSWQEAFESAGVGGWKLFALVKPDVSLENAVS